MIIDNLDIVGVSTFPAKADPPLIIDPDAPLAIAVTGKLFQPVARWDTQKVESGGAAKLFQLALGNSLHILRQLWRKPAVK